MALSNAIMTYYTYKLAVYLTKPFKEWEMYKKGLIDEKGNLIKKPKTKEEKELLSPFMNFIRKLKWFFVKYFNKNDSKSINMLLFYLLVRDGKVKKESADEFEIFLQKIFEETSPPFTLEEFKQMVENIQKGA